eukprot:59126_1
MIVALEKDQLNQYQRHLHKGSCIGFGIDGFTTANTTTNTARISWTYCHIHRASQLTSLPLPTQRINPNHRHLRLMRIAIQTTKLRRHYNATYFAINSTKLVGLLPARSHAMVVFCVPDNLEYLNQIDACFEWNYASSIHHILKCRIRTHSLKYVKASPDPADETYSHWYPGLRKVDPYLYPPSHRSRPNAHASQSPPASQQQGVTHRSQPSQPQGLPPPQAQQQHAQQRYPSHHSMHLSLEG